MAAQRYGEMAFGNGKIGSRLSFGQPTPIST